MGVARSVVLPLTRRALPAALSTPAGLWLINTLHRRLTLAGKRRFFHAFGEMEHPVTGDRSYAVVQLRKEDLSDEYFNIVGFQTKMKVPEQKRVIQMIPGLEQAVFARFGSMHRNTFINGPRHLRPTFQTKRDERTFFAGQITGVEGYIESAAVGLLVSRYIDELSRTGSATPLPYHTALGALGRHVAESSPDRYQPSNVTWALIEDAIGKVRKAEKRERQVEKALATIEALTSAPQVA